MGSGVAVVEKPVKPGPFMEKVLDAIINLDGKAHPEAIRAFMSVKINDEVERSQVDAALKTFIQRGWVNFTYGPRPDKPKFQVKFFTLTDLGETVFANRGL